MKFIKLFETHDPDYLDYINSDDVILPNLSYCEDEEKVHLNKLIDYSKIYLTFTALEDTKYSFTNNDLQYSTDDGNTWLTLTAGESTPTITSGTNILWKCDNPTINYGIGRFDSTGNFEIKGNIMSLLYGDNFKNQTDLTGKNYCFYQLFQFRDKLISAKNLILPATTLSNWCYQYMFQGCTALTTAPELPATTLGTACYLSMFENCSSLITAPNILPSVTLTLYCYQNMFNSCTSLTTAPELPATTLATSCYQNMFDGCTSLNYIKAMFTTTPSSTYTDSWVSSVSSTGTFIKNSAAEWDVTGVNGVPIGWTVETASE